MTVSQGGSPASRERLTIIENIGMQLGKVKNMEITPFTPPDTYLYFSMGILKLCCQDAMASPPATAAKVISVCIAIA